MNSDKTALLLKLVGLALAAAVAVGLQARERATGNTDLYGYTIQASDSDDGCRFDYISLDGAGSSLPRSAGHEAAASDDLAAVLPLSQPFEFYQLPSAALVVSDNGYLAAADSTRREDGSDFSNDCRLPALADNRHAVNNRIYVYHDDLRPQAGGGLRKAYFPRCPRPGRDGGHEACTVVEWHRYERATPIPSSQPLQAQAVLYHGSHEIAMQYASVDDSQGAQATIGLQGFDGRTARQSGCNMPEQVKPRQAICFFDPRQRDVRDLQ